MSYNTYGGSSGYGGWGSGGGERVPGARRQKVLGYLKAANELRQSYAAQWRTETDGMPGAFPDVDIVRSEDEEMLLFPSYARVHTSRGHEHQRSRNASERQALQRPDTPGDADYWKRQWEIHEDNNAVVDVDVRGWIYAPQKGPMTRRNRLLVAIARRLSGIPALDTSPAGSRESSVGPGSRRKEEETAAEEADRLARHGQREIDAALRGSYSSTSSRSTSPSGQSMRIPVDDERPPGLPQRTSWGTQTEYMTRQEIEKANEQLMTRLRPFMTFPSANIPITVFFFNQQKSTSKTVTTDESGHFNLRAALDFVPSQVRVLASEKLSAIEDVIVTESQGISLISDIDDTIKHSAIASGAKEIFKNTFIRDLNELTIQGVKEWYTKMMNLGVKLHYVSNSPWQLYPLLKSYFHLAGLPSGSMHLKQYSGMLQGIFEPAAERKKGSLERIIHDFPDRKFILVGDSGEADLEVYTDIVLASPGRVLGVFIRDVTTSEKKNTARQFFDQVRHGSDAGQLSDSPKARPALPARPQAGPVEDLIDLREETDFQQPKRSQTSYLEDMHQLSLDAGGQVGPPTRPAKPSNLRSFATISPPPQRRDSPDANGLDPKRSPPPPPPPPPPRPRKSSKAVEMQATTNEGSQQPPLVARQYSAPPGMPPSSSRHPHTSATSTRYTDREEEGYLASARRQISSAYNALPPLRSSSPTGDGLSNSPPRRSLASYPAAAARWATGGEPTAGGDGGYAGAPYNKKEEMWKRRWARAEEIMRREGVVLRAWRVGSDVMDECIRLVERSQRDRSP